MFRILLFLVIFFYVSCHYKATPNGQITATKNLVSWSSKATAIFEPAFGDSLISVVGKVYSNKGYIREELAFFKIPPREGVYEVFIGCSSHI